MKNTTYIERALMAVLIVLCVLAAVAILSDDRADGQEGPWTTVPSTTVLPPCTGQAGDAWDNCTPVPTIPSTTTIPFDDGDPYPGDDVYPIPSGPVYADPVFTG